MGKLSVEDLRRVLSCIEKHPKVVVPPSPGFDSGVHLIGDTYLVVSTDPCIGVPEKWFGWLLVHYAASDVALFAAKPEFCTINLLGPPATKPEIFIEIMRQTCRAATEIGMTVTTGHTGTYEGLETIVGVCTAYGTVSKDKLIVPSGARPGDSIMSTKPIGLETVVNFSLEREALARELFGAQRVQELGQLVSLQSCVKEALLLAETGCVHAMHDATEGGLTTALNEIADASNAGFQVELQKIPIPKEVYVLQKYFHLSIEQVLSTSSAGTILVAVDPQGRNKVDDVLHQHGFETSFLGSFTKNKLRILLKNGKRTRFPREAKDPYTKIMCDHQ